MDRTAYFLARQGYELAECWGCHYITLCLETYEPGYGYYIPVCADCLARASEGIAD